VLNQQEKLHLGTKLVLTQTHWGRHSGRWNPVIFSSTNYPDEPGVQEALRTTSWKMDRWGA
jgi:hypothetical protein